MAVQKSIAHSHAPLRPVPLPPGPPIDPPCPGLYQPAGSYNRDDLLLDPALEQEIDVHLALHLVPGLGTQTERILFVVGEPGDGKTTAVRTVASRRGLGLLIMAGADLAGSVEGAPLDKLAQAEAWLRWRSAATGERFAMLLDDVDASILSENADQERTVNSNLLIGKIQQIATTPEAFTNPNGQPIPWLWTGNSVATFRAPLIRAGRCRLLHYRLEWDRKADMLVHSVKPRTDCERRRLRALVWHFRHRPIAWFLALHAELRRNAIAAAVARHGLHDPDAVRGAVPAADHVDVRALYRLARLRDADADQKS